MRQRNPRERDEKHLAYIRTLPCVVCLNPIETEAAHIRMGDRRVAKVNPGIGQKPHDLWTVPLCSSCHRKQHAGSEMAFWDEAMIDPIFVAMALFINSGNHEAGCQIVSEQH